MKMGLYGKYILAKADNTEIDPKAKYFVLRLDTDNAARQAAMVYAELIKDEQLREDLCKLIADCIPESQPPASTTTEEK